MSRFSLYFLLSLALHAVAGLLLRESTLGAGRPQEAALPAELAVMTIQLQAAPQTLAVAPSAAPPATAVQAPPVVAPVAPVRAKVPARAPAKAPPQRQPLPPKPVQLAAKTAPAVSRSELATATATTTATAAQLPMQSVVREVFSRAPAFLQPPAPPRYPTQARRRNQHGVVLLEVRLDERGQQRALQVLRSSGVASLDEAAVQAVAAWRFRPETEDGRPVPSRVQIPIEFALTASR
ncbi:energy transducer TonB [Pseudomonas cavernicola]|uniref:Energy transducer TonB n=1 Tax=Pseudomonas cavernicola TaxID=2320866 RepID=A0A418XD92_9PSED|nr:energy transducer TonB [Pseudomonas cavernicola]RJG10484.1 energy transducer TonB [Pseudomonas cavernicola]